MATQDRALRVALGQRPGGASVFVSVNGVHLEPPSDSQKAQSGQVRRLQGGIYVEPACTTRAPLRSSPGR